MSGRAIGVALRKMITEVAVLEDVEEDERRAVDRNVIEPGVGHPNLETDQCCDHDCQRRMASVELLQVKVQQVLLHERCHGHGY
uniref:Uncharacterized protein n=1 Tax=Triticum urartu TaxID=4572 RepID=A0A8R7UD26_TRIUA